MYCLQEDLLRLLMSLHKACDCDSADPLTLKFFTQMRDEGRTGIMRVALHDSLVRRAVEARRLAWGMGSETAALFYHL